MWSNIDIFILCLLSMWSNIGIFILCLLSMWSNIGIFILCLLSMSSKIGIFILYLLSMSSNIGIFILYLFSMSSNIGILHCCISMSSKIGIFHCCIRKLWKYHRGSQKIRRTDNTMVKRKKKIKGQTMTYKTLFRKLKIEHNAGESHWIPRVSFPLMASVLLLLLQTQWYEWGKDRIVIMTNGTYLWSFMAQIFCSG
jgi:hypothetical protein